MNNDQWPYKTLHTLDNLDIGWSKGIRETLSNYGMPTDFTIIKTISRRQWKKRICEKVEAKNLCRLLDNCHKTENGVRTPETKTAHLIPFLTSKNRLKRSSIHPNMTQKQSLLPGLVCLTVAKTMEGNMSELCNECHQMMKTTV